MRIRVASVSDLRERKVIKTWWENEPVAVFWTEAGPRAVSDTCTHADCSLSEGTREGMVVICPCHGARFSLDHGAVLSFPAVYPLQSFPVIIEDGEVFIETPD
jgi:nitrite reductase/ring-hydroxylating ferredoxin subunit